MNQYCRYCAFCINGDAYYCTSKETLLSKSGVMRANKCSDYQYSELGDVDSGRHYSPRQRNKKSIMQENLFGEEK